MALDILNTKALASIDNGELAAALDRELRLAVADLVDRPTDQRPRKVNLMIALSPAYFDNKGDLEEVRVGFALSGTVPKKTGREFRMSVRNGEKLVFNDLSPGAPGQSIIPGMEGKPSGGSGGLDAGDSEATR